MTLTFLHSRACLPTSLAHVFVLLSLFARSSCILVFPALPTHGPLSPTCIRAAFLFVGASAFSPGKGFLVNQIRLSHPTDFRSFLPPLSTLLHSPRAVCYTELHFQLLGITKCIFHLSPFFSPSGEGTIVSFSRAPFTSAGGRFTPAWFPGSCCSCSHEQGLQHLSVPFSLCCIPSGVRSREGSCLGPMEQL